MKSAAEQFDEKRVSRSLAAHIVIRSSAPMVPGCAVFEIKAITGVISEKALSCPPSSIFGREGLSEDTAEDAAEDAEEDAAEEAPDEAAFDELVPEEATDELPAAEDAPEFPDSEPLFPPKAPAI